MNTNKKVLTILVLLLLIANVVTIALFWLKGGDKPTQIKGGPAKFIIKELNLNSQQQEQYLTLVEEHQTGVRRIRAEIKEAKDTFFGLLRQPQITEPEKIAASKKISAFTEQLDLFTLNHFAKLRAICDAKQQKKFDEIIKQVIQMMGEQRNRKGPPPLPDAHHPDGPPPHKGEEFSPPIN